MINYNSSPNPTIGVEIELQFIDINTLDLKNIAPKVLADIDKKFSSRERFYFIITNSYYRYIIIRQMRRRRQLNFMI